MQNHSRFWSVVLLALVTGGCAMQRGNSVDIYVRSMQPLPSSLFEQRVKIDLRLQNLTESALEVTGVDLRLDVNGRRLARGVSDKALTLPRLGEGQVSVNVSSGVFDTVRQLLGLQQRTSFSYTLSGKLFTPGIDRRFSKSGELTREDLALFVKGAAGVR